MVMGTPGSHLRPSFTAQPGSRLGLLPARAARFGGFGLADGRFCSTTRSPVSEMGSQGSAGGAGAGSPALLLRGVLLAAAAAAEAAAACPRR